MGHFTLSNWFYLYYWCPVRIIPLGQSGHFSTFWKLQYAPMHCSSFNSADRGPCLALRMVEGCRISHDLLHRVIRHRLKCLQSVQLNSVKLNHPYAFFVLFHGALSKSLPSFRQTFSTAGRVSNELPRSGFCLPRSAVRCSRHREVCNAFCPSSGVFGTRFRGVF